MERQERWQLSGDSAEYYDRYVSRLMEPWVKALVGTAQLQPSDRVLDVGCGPGFVARRAAEIVSTDGRVVGMDNNEVMLNKARESQPSETAVRIEWRQGDAQSLPFDDESFDVALAQQVLQFCPQPAIAFQEIRRVLVPGGRLAFTVWQHLEDNPYPVVQVGVFERHLGSEAASLLRAPHSMGNAEELKELVSSAGFSHVEINSSIKAAHVGPAEEFIRGHIPALPFASLVAALSNAAREVMFNELISGLSHYVFEGMLEFPTACHLVTANA